jgi:hypothetical protein
LKSGSLHLSDRIDSAGSLCSMSSKPFAVPAGSVEIAIPGGDFETDGRLPPGWVADLGKVVVASDAPQGEAYARAPAPRRAAAVPR